MRHSKYMLWHIRPETCYCYENVQKIHFSWENRKADRPATCATRRFFKKANLLFCRKRQVAQVAAWRGHIPLSCATSATTSASSGQFGAGLEPVLACLGLSLACPGPVLNILQLVLAYLGLEVSSLNDTNVNSHRKR